MPARIADPAKPLRLFLALWPDDPTREAIAAWQRSWVWPPRASVVRPERLHLTLHFLGDVPAREVARLIGALRMTMAPVVLPLDRGELWPHGIAVLASGRTPPALARLHAALGRVIAAFGLPLDEKPFRPHVTLARHAMGAVAPPGGLALAWRARQGYVLVQSLPAGAGYQVVERFT